MLRQTHRSRTAVIDPTHAGNAVPPGYIGFSHEWGQAQLLMGDPAIGTNPIYRQLLDNLTGVRRRTDINPRRWE